MWADMPDLLIVRGDKGDHLRGERVRMLVDMVVTEVRLCQQNRKSTQIYANREPIHPRLAPLKSRGAGGSLGKWWPSQKVLRAQSYFER